MSKDGGDSRIATLEDEINNLHTCLEDMGINARGTTDIFGRKFHVPVNGEHKATKFTVSMLFSAAQPHMRTFWASTFGFFTTFFSVFTPAGIMPYLRGSKADGGLGLTLDEVSTSGNLAVTGTILMRVLAGPMCDKLGARKTFIVLLTIALPGMALIMCSNSAGPFILGRIIVGLSLATFVTCQVWCSQFFERKIVGTVNATAGGWGNVGGGITMLIVPQIMEALISTFEKSKGLAGAIDISWRLCFVLPMLMHIGAAIFVWTGRDLADGSYGELETSGAKQKSAGAGSGLQIVKVGFSNTNAIIMSITYGLCFGVELTMNNKLVGLFNRYYAIKPRSASVLGATFSLMNLFARSWGGLLSDLCAKRYGIRGRIASMWVLQTMCGVFCVVLGLITNGKTNPDSPYWREWTNVDFGGGKLVPGMYEYTGGLDTVDYYINGTGGLVKPCGSKFIKAPRFGFAGSDCPRRTNYDGVGNGTTPSGEPLKDCWPAPIDGTYEGEERYGRFPVKGRIMIMDPRDDCVHNGDTLGVTMIVIILFSICVQMAEGLHFGIVPYISRPALGVVSGMVGAGGNFGAMYGGQWVVRAKSPLDSGFIYLGVIIMSVSLLMHFIFFPGEGGILLPKNFPYDPQHIKPPADAKGSDELNFDNVTATKGDAKASSVA